MAVTFVSAASQNDADPVSLTTITIPAGVLADDLLFVNVAVQSGSGFTGVSDDDSGGNTWTRVATTDFIGTYTYFGEHVVWWKRATSGTASKTITVAGNGGHSMSAGLAVYRGGSTAATPYSNVNAYYATSGTESAASFTPSAANSFICFFLGITDGNATVTSISAATLGTLAIRFQEESTASAGVTCVHASLAQVGGPTGTGQITWAQADMPGFWASLAIKPGAGGATTTTTVVTSLTAMLKKQNIQRTATLNALLKKLEISQSAQLDAMLVKRILLTAGMNALLKKTVTTTGQLDALLKAVGVSRTALLDALLVSAGTGLKSAFIDALLLKTGVQRTAIIDALLMKVENRTAVIDAILSLRGTITASLDGMLLANVRKSVSLDAKLIGIFGWSAISGGSASWSPDAAPGGLWTPDTDGGGTWTSI